MFVIRKNVFGLSSRITIAVTKIFENMEQERYMITLVTTLNVYKKGI